MRKKIRVLESFLPNSLQPRYQIVRINKSTKQAAYVIYKSRGLKPEPKRFVENHCITTDRITFNKKTSSVHYSSESVCT